MTIFTVGHSTHPIDEFIGILKAHGVKKLIDVRTVPKSRHNPQFNGDALAASVRANGITYRRMESLGGLRHARKDSPNGAWRNASFRGYADYMQTEEFSAPSTSCWNAGGPTMRRSCARKPSLGAATAR